MDVFNIQNFRTNQQISFIINKTSFLNGTILSLENNCFAVKILSTNDNYKSFSKNDNAEFLFAYSDVAYRCSATILGSTITDAYEIILLTPPNIIKKIERRKYPRVNTLLDLKYYFINDNIDNMNLSEITKKYSRQFKKTYTINISGGGIKFVAMKDPANAKYILISLQLEKQINALCSIVRVENNESSNNFLVSVKFEDMMNKDKDIIIDYANELIKSNKV